MMYCYIDMISLFKIFILVPHNLYLLQQALIDEYKVNINFIEHRSSHLISRPITQHFLTRRIISRTKLMTTTDIPAMISGLLTDLLLSLMARYFTIILSISSCVMSSAEFSDQSSIAVGNISISTVGCKIEKFIDHQFSMSISIFYTDACLYYEILNLNA